VLRRCFLTLGFGLAVLLAHVRADDLTVVRDDWPLFRGNAQQTGVSANSLPRELEVRWTFKTKDSVESTAAIVGNTVYVGSNDEHLYALDLDTGKEKWNYKTAPFKAPVSVQKRLVYVGDSDGIFHCVDAATGKPKWTFKTDSDISSGANFTGDKVLFGSGDENLYCLSLDGKEQWRFKVPGGPVLGTPVIVGNRTFAAGCDSSLHVIDTATGKEVGNPVNLGGQVGATAAVLGDSIFVCTMSDEVLAIDWKKGEILWRFMPMKNRQGFASAPAATDKLIIAGSKDKRVYALDRQTGQQVWSFLTKNKVDSSAVVVGQRVFVGSQDHQLYILDLASGSELQRFNLGAPVTSSPAVAGNCLVIGTDDGTVHCLGTKK
jgi:outer membrane protein assembly factor BamB